MRNELLDEIGPDFNTRYPKNYFSVQTYQAEGFLGAVLPPTRFESGKFYAPRVLSILILAKPYGWDGEDFDWPHPDLQEQIDQLKNQYEQWTEYKVHIYIDFSIAEEADDDYLTKLLVTEESVIEMCDELADYGLVYKGHLPNDPDWSLFKEDVDDWFRLPLPS